MAGLLGDVLPWAYSQGDRAKRYVDGLLSDPWGVITREVNYANDRAGGLLQMTQAAADEGLRWGPANQRLAGLLADSYNPVGMVNAKGASYKGGKLGPDYQIDHKPMNVGGGAAQLHDLEPVFGKDIYGPSARQFYGSGGADVFGQAERAVLRKMAEVRGKPDAMVTIYRGVPDGVSNINPGDWVTLDPRVAREYGNVISQQVPASHVTSWPDSLLEFGYFPK